MQNTGARRKLDLAFPRRVAVWFCILAALSVYPLTAIASGDVTRAFVAGAAIGLANVLAGYAAIEYSIDKSYTVFLRSVLGGTGVRMLAMLLLLVVLIKFYHFNATALVVSLLIFYSLFLVLEIMFIQKRMTRRVEG